MGSSLTTLYRPIPLWNQDFKQMTTIFANRLNQSSQIMQRGADDKALVPVERQWATFS